MLKRILNWIWEFVEILIIVYVIFITSCILCRNKYGYTQFGNMTLVTVNDSNLKFIANSNSGDLLVIKEQQTGLDVGDLIYYYVTVDEKYIVRTGIIESKTEDDYAALYVLKDSDGTSIASNRVIGKYVKNYSNTGGILDVLESRIGFLFLVLLPILIVFIYQVYQLVVVAKYEEVLDDDRKGLSKKEENGEKKVIEKQVEKKEKEKEEIKQELIEKDTTSEENKDDDIELL